MEKTYVPQIGTTLTVLEYVRRFGPKRNLHGLRKRPDTHCRVCMTQTHTVGENIPGRVAVWAHNPSKVWCPLKDSAKVPYELLPPTSPDVAAGKLLRTSFLLNWVVHWTFIRSIVSRCDILQLIEFVRHADKTNFWAHVGLQEWYLPYIFLSLFDFPPPSRGNGAGGQPTWIRCYFDARIRSHRDLWIETDGNWKFFIAHYSVPAGKASPGPKHFIREDEAEVSNTFLNAPPVPPHAFATNKMSAAFPGEVP